MAVASAPALQHADHYLGILEPYKGDNFVFTQIRVGLTNDLEYLADKARRAGEAGHAERLLRFAREQASRPSVGPESWNGIVADVERARSLVAGDGTFYVPAVADAYVVDLCVDAEAPAIEAGPNGVDAFVVPILVSREAWYAALDAARGRAGRQTTPAPVVRFSCGAVLACEGATHHVPIEGEPGRYDVSRTRLIPIREQESTCEQVSVRGDSSCCEE